MHTACTACVRTAMSTAPQHLDKNHVYFGDVRHVVIDEVDTMFEAGFGDELERWPCSNSNPDPSPCPNLNHPIPNPEPSPNPEPDPHPHPNPSPKP